MQVHTGLTDTYIYGLNNMTPRERSSFVQTAQAMKDHYGASVGDVTALNFAEDYLIIDGMYSPTTGGLTHISDTGPVLEISLRNIRENARDGALAYRLDPTGEDDISSKAKTHPFVTMNGVASSPEMVSAEPYAVHEMAHIVHYHKLAEKLQHQRQAFLDSPLIPFEKAYKAMSEDHDLINRLWHDSTPFDPNTLYQQERSDVEDLTSQQQIVSMTEPPSIIPSMYAYKNVAEWYAEMVTAEMQGRPIPNPDEFHAIDDIAREPLIPGQEALDIAPAVAAALPPEEEIMVWTQEYGWALIDDFGWNKEEPVIAAGMVPIRSAADVAAAVEIATNEPSMRWYVERRAQALGVDDVVFPWRISDA